MKHQNRARGGVSHAIERLVDDESVRVRAAVAEQGYGLEWLRKDRNAMVRSAAESKLEEIELEKRKG